MRALTFACGDNLVNREKLEGVEEQTDGTWWERLSKLLWCESYNTVCELQEPGGDKFIEIEDMKTRAVFVSLVEYKGTCKESEGMKPECWKWKKAIFSNTKKVYNTFTKVYWLFNSAAPLSNSHLK